MFKNIENKNCKELSNFRKGVKSFWFLKHPNQSLKSTGENKSILNKYVPPLLF